MTVSVLFMSLVHIVSCVVELARQTDALMAVHISFRGKVLVGTHWAHCNIVSKLFNSIHIASNLTWYM